jgi:cysteine/O-acetylserine efflux protein
MMSLLSIISYVLVSSFTPGPSNISTVSMAILHGYKATLKYQFGLALGVFLLMSLSGLFSAALLNVFPALEPILRYLGAAYILYLAFAILNASYTFAEKDIKPLGVGNGFVLQILNPKLTVYAFSLFGTFLASATGNFMLVVFLALVLAVVSFGATTTWALFGTAIKNYLQHPRLRMLINILLSLALIYSAVSLLEITQFLLPLLHSL